MLTRNEYENSLENIRSQLDYFLNNEGDIEILEKNCKIILPDLVGCPGFNETNKLYAWYPTPTAWCPSELNTSAEVSCSTASHCGTRKCRSDEEVEDRDETTDDTYTPSIPRP